MSTHEIYTDKDLDIEIHYVLHPDDIVYGHEIEIRELHINGDRIHLQLECMLKEKYEVIWEKEILDKIRGGL